MMLLCVRNKFYNKRRHTYNGGGLYALNIFPLHAGHTWAYAQHAGAQFTDTVVIRHSGHKLPVERKHQLINITVSAIGTAKGNVFVITQPLQIFLR